VIKHSAETSDIVRYSRGEPTYFYSDGPIVLNIMMTYQYRVLTTQTDTRQAQDIFVKSLLVQAYRCAGEDSDSDGI
jgi:hypothetical protein